MVQIKYLQGNINRQGTTIVFKCYNALGQKGQHF